MLPQLTDEKLNLTAYYLGNLATLHARQVSYKAVQRTSGAVAIGPLMQGLNKPVNDLSRGCTVTDIVNTVAMTAI